MTNGNLNNIAVVALGGTNQRRPGGRSDSYRLVSELGEPQQRWQHGRTWSMRSRRRARIRTGAMRTGRRIIPTCTPANEYNPQLTKAGLQSFPLASATAGAASGADRAGNHEQPVLQHLQPPAAVMAAVHAGRPARHLHPQGKPDLRPDSGRPGARQWRSHFGAVWTGDHAQSA